MNREDKIQILKASSKKLDDLKEFNIPVIIKTIEEYESAGADKIFIEQQQALLDKVYARIDELEGKRKRLLEELSKEKER